MKTSTTAMGRKWNMVLLGLTVVFALTGWMLGRDPGALGPLMTLLAATTAIGEGSSAAKKKITGDTS